MNDKTRNEELSEKEASVAKKAANEFFYLLEAEQSSQSKGQAQDFAERMTDYVPASHLKKNKR